MLGSPGSVRRLYHFLSLFSASAYSTQTQHNSTVHRAAQCTWKPAYDVPNKASCGSRAYLVVLSQPLWHWAMLIATPPGVQGSRLPLHSSPATEATAGLVSLSPLDDLGKAGGGDGGGGALQLGLTAAASRTWAVSGAGAAAPAENRAQGGGQAVPSKQGAAAVALSFARQSVQSRHGAKGTAELDTLAAVLWGYTESFKFTCRVLFLFVTPP